MGDRSNGDHAGLLDHVLVPLANAADARETARSIEALEPDRVTLVYVVEKASGAPDKTPVEQSESEAREAFDTFREESTLQEVEETMRYRRDVVGAILDTATDVEATAIAFRPRGGSRITQWLAGDKTLKLVTRADRPVIALPGPEEQ